MMGDYLMVDWEETEEQAEKKLEENFWDIVLRMSIAVSTRTVVEAIERMDEEIQKKAEEKNLGQ